MQFITSEDGTKIAYKKSGQGPALIIVGGALVDHNTYMPVAAELAKHFTVYNYDRRGRGQSGDVQPYSVEREIEDIATLISEADQQQIYIYGHSAGSALSLKAAASNLGITKLILVDLPFGPRGINDEKIKEQFAKQKTTIKRLHDKGDYKGAASFFLSGFGMPPEAVESILSSPAGERMIDCARALPYDFAMLGDGLAPTDFAAKVGIPTLIMAAGTHPETAQQLVDVMSDAQFKAMSASAHDLPAVDIVQAVLPFLEAQG